MGQAKAVATAPERPALAKPHRHARAQPATPRPFIQKKRTEVDADAKKPAPAAPLTLVPATEVPTPLADPLPVYRAVHEAIAGGLVSAAHDCSDGGIAVAIAEMAVAARQGVSVVVPADGLDPFTALVNEAPGRFVLSSAPENRDAVRAALGDHARSIGFRMRRTIFRFGSRPWTCAIDPSSRSQ